MIRAILAAAAIASYWAVPAAAQDDVSQQIINVPAPESFSVYGLPAPPKVRKDGSVQGGRALRVNIPGGGDSPWTIGLSGPVAKPIRSGDKLVLAFWARFDKAEGASVRIANVGVQLSKEPYTALFNQAVDIGPEWKLYNVEGKAERDYAAGEVGISMHLATGKQVIDFGPIFLLDLGQ